MQMPRQTLSYLRNLFEERGIRPKSKLGQNFLVDLNLLELLMATAELTSDDLALEVGSGTGSLTTRLAQLAGAVLSVELDSDFYSLVSEIVADLPNVRLLHADVLRNKNELNRHVLEALEQMQREFGCPRLKLVANLPYAVAVPVLANLLISDLAVERMVVTIQWEIAERLTASPSTKNFGALAVLVQSLADVAIIRRLPPSVFWPRPQVASAIVLIRPNPAKRRQVGDVPRFREFLRDLYTHRRKNLRAVLSGWSRRPRSKDEVDHMLAQLGIDGTLRAESLSLEQHRRLCEAFG
jgi:16S rRNA (adenine1518-N6/adenine1519-N6)-dimethyltransferase